MNTPSPKQFLQDLASYGIKPIDPPNRIIYKYASFETALQIIENKTLLFSSPKSFNDPFDLTNSLIDKSFTESDLLELIDTSSVEPSTRKQLLENYANNPSQINEIFERILNSAKDQIGISCFSKSHKNTLLWSHYADKHAGVSLGFEIIALGVENFMLLEVSYINKIQPINFNKNKHLSLVHWLFTKSKIWEYEEEVRAVFLYKNGFIDFAVKCLKEVHFGLRTTKDQRDEITSTLKKVGYTIDKMTLMEIDPATFDLKGTLY